MFDVDAVKYNIELISQTNAVLQRLCIFRYIFEREPRREAPRDQASVTLGDS